MKIFYITSLIVIVLLDSAATAQNIDSTLIGWYSLDGLAGDQSVYSNNGTMFNLISSTDRFGDQSGAMEFDGSSGYISIPSSPSLASPDSTITMSAWIYMYGTAGARSEPHSIRY